MHADDASVEADLDDFLDIHVPLDANIEWDPDDEEEPPIVAAPDEDFADRLLYKGRRLQAEQESVDRIAQRRHAEIDAWYADRTSGIRRETTWLQRSLEMFTRKWQRSHPRTKTLHLPNGDLSLRAPGRGKVVVQDEQAFIGWARRNKRDALMRVEYKPAKAALADVDIVKRKEHLQINDADSGELVQSFQLLFDVPTDKQEKDGTPVIETAVIPGVLYTERLQDSFTMTLRQDEKQEEE